MGPNRVEFSFSSTEDGNRPSFQKVVFPGIPKDFVLYAVARVLSVKFPNANKVSNLAGIFWKFSILCIITLVSKKNP
jgi:hypothetical protein